jgi:hypothetical protein
VSDRLSNLESRVDELARQVSALERRISALDRGETAAEAPPSARPAPESDVGAVFALVGRTLLALGGAYLLRALTGGGTLAPVVGVSLAAAYAAAWVFLADRAGAAGKPTSASFHVGSAALIGYPLLWETTLRLHLLGPAASAFALVGFTVAILAVARRRRLEGGAWVGSIAADATAVALLFGTRAVVPFVAALVVLGLATLGLQDSKGSPLAWIGAGVADVAVVLLTLGAVIQNAGFSIDAAILVQLALFLGYFAVFFRRDVVQGNEATWFEIAQGAAATLVGYGGATILADSEAAAIAVPLVGLVVAALGYGALSRSLSKAGGERTGFFFAGLALAAVLFAAGAALSRPAWPWTILALAFFALGKRIPAVVLGLHGAVYLFAAAAASGLVRFWLWAFAAKATTAWPPFSSSSLLVLGTALACLFLGVPEGAARTEGRWWPRLPPALALLVALLGASAAAILLLSSLASVGSGEFDPARLAALRTALLAVAAVGLAALSARARLKEAGWLSYALLALGGIKLIVEDFPRGRPGTLFLALAFYGAALILAPRLRQSTRR